MLMHFCREEISKAKLNQIRGLDQHDRIDEALYHDYETEEAKKVTHAWLPKSCCAASSILLGTWPAIKHSKQQQAEAVC
jgi:hypothetical protein